MTERPAMPPGRLKELAAVFLRLGTTAFGGPAAHVAIMHDELVRRRGWVDDQTFLDLNAATNLIPGPNSTELAIHLGHVRGRWRGMLVAGSCFILPAFVMVLVLSWLYVEYAATPAVEGVLYGIQPVIIAIIVQALVKLSGVALRTPLLWAVSLVALVAYLLGVFELVLLAAGGVVVLAVRAARRGSGPGLAAAAFTLLPLAPVRASSPGDLVTLFLTFLKIGAILYGGGYVLLAFLRSDFVVRLGWLTEQQLLDGVAIGQVTPGPLFTTATFVGYVTNGWAGAVVATVAIFLPSFVFVGLLSRLVPWFRMHRWTADALDGINAAAIALMAGVAWQLGQAAIVDPLTAAFAVIAGLLLWRTRWNSAWLILGGALAGLAHQVVTG